jgi:hypothetical protein
MKKRGAALTLIDVGLLMIIAASAGANRENPNSALCETFASLREIKTA